MTNIKKATLAAIIILVTIIGICIASFATNKGTIQKEAKLRKQASNDSTVLEIIPKKEEVEILDKVGDWYQVRYNKIKGYVAKDFLEVIEESDTKEQNEDTQNNESKTKVIKKGETFKIEKEAKIYVRPLINSKVIKTIEKDKTVNVIEIRNNWAYINIDDVSGWVSLTSIGAILPNEESGNENNELNTNNNQNENNNQPENNNNESNKQEENNNENSNNKTESSNNENNKKEELNKTAYVVTTGINFREEPNTDSKVLKVFAQNAKITILEEIGDWYKIKHNDQIGYVLKSYVSSKKTETTSRSSIDRTSSVENKTQDQAKEENKSTTSSSSNKGQEVANYVKQFIGYRYVYGGSTPKGGFDCSGLTMYVYKQFGVSLSHSATAQSKQGTKVSKSDLQPGDLVFFSNYKTGKGIGHVGIYIGNNQFVHASTEKTGVITSSITSGSYSRRYVTATRMF